MYSLSEINHLVLTGSEIVRGPTEFRVFSRIFGHPEISVNADFSHQLSMWNVIPMWLFHWNPFDGKYQHSFTDLFLRVFLLGFACLFINKNCPNGTLIMCIQDTTYRK